MTSTIALIVFSRWVRRFRSLQQVFLESPALDRAVERLERLQQWLHQLERPGIGPVRQRLFRVGMRLHEYARDSARDRGAREHGDVFALPAARGALSARQ